MTSPNCDYTDNIIDLIDTVQYSLIIKPFEMSIYSSLHYEAIFGRFAPFKNFDFSHIYAVVEPAIRQFFHLSNQPPRSRNASNSPSGP